MIGDKQLAKIVFDHLLEVIALTLPYQEKDFGGTITRTETHTPKAVSDITANPVSIHPKLFRKWLHLCISI